MKVTKLIALAFATVCTTLAPQASAQSYNQEIVAIFGSGNPKEGWTKNSENGFDVYGRGKDRVTGDTTNTDGVYQMFAGYYGVRATWNFEFGVRNANGNLGNVEVYVAVDDDASAGVNLANVIDVTQIPDNSFGTDATLQGQGIEGPWNTMAPTYNVVQQSHNVTFYPGNIGIDPTVDGTYDFEVYVTQKGTGAAGEKLASVNFTVKVGNGGKTVEALFADLAASATNHGDYCSAVSALARYLNEGGVIDKKRRQQIITAAAQSSVGK